MHLLFDISILLVQVIMYYVVPCYIALRCTKATVLSDRKYLKWYEILICLIPYINIAIVLGMALAFADDIIDKEEKGE